MSDDQELTPSHAISVKVLPTEEWLAALTVHTHDAEGGVTTVTLHPHEAYTLGTILVRYGILLNGYNETLADKTVEARQEIMELTEMLNAPSAEDPFDPQPDLSDH